MAGFAADADPSRKDPQCPIPTIPTSLALSSILRRPSLSLSSASTPLSNSGNDNTHLIANQQHIPKALRHYQRMPLPATLQERIRGDCRREPDGGELVDGEGLA